MFDFNAVRPDLAGTLNNLFESLKSSRRLPDRLVELIRLRIAFHNQCRFCMSVRYGDGVDDGVNENLVCSLERPSDAPDLTEGEKAALGFADRFATDHLSIGPEQFEALDRHFDRGEIAEIAMMCGVFVGFGRMGAVLDPGAELPVGERQQDGSSLTPWGIEPMVLR